MIPIKSLSDFNSIKVQLEPLYALGLIAAYLFQFHKGTIRTHDVFARHLVS